MCPRCARLGLFITTAGRRGSPPPPRSGPARPRRAQDRAGSRIPADQTRRQSRHPGLPGHHPGPLPGHHRPRDTHRRQAIFDRYASEEAGNYFLDHSRPTAAYSGARTRGSPAATPNASARPQAPVVPDGQGREGPDRPHRRSPQTDRGGQRPATDGTALSANGRVADTLCSSAGRCSVLACDPQVIDGRRISRARSADPARQRQKIACVTRAEPPLWSGSQSCA